MEGAGIAESHEYTFVSLPNLAWLPHKYQVGGTNEFYSHLRFSA